MRNNVLQTAAFARRVVCRALTVVGGVAAGTALAWCLSTTSASAEDLSPAEDQLAAAVGEAAAPVDHVIDIVVRNLQDPQATPKAPLPDLGETVKGAAKQFRGQPELSQPPACATPCLGVEKHHFAADEFGRSAVPATPALTQAASTVTPGAAEVTVAPRTAKERAAADGMSRRGSPEPVKPGLPDLPGWPAPRAPSPAGVPTTGNHGSAGNAADSHPFAALLWQNSATDLVAGGIAAAATKAAVVGRPGAQPGVAPD